MRTIFTSALNPMHAVGLAMTLGLIPAHAIGTVSLTNLTPSQSTVSNPSQDGHPSVYAIDSLQVQPNLSGSSLHILSESSTSFAIPSGEHSFSGILAYAVTDSSQVNNADPDNRVRLQILVDGQLVFEAGMTKNTPPLQFAIPLGAAPRTLTIQSDSVSGFDRVFIVNPNLAPSTVSFSSHYLPKALAGYVDVSTQARQSMFGIFRPGEVVSAHAYYGGTATSAAVSIKVQPESGAPTISSAFTVPLVTSLGVASGAFTWNVPNLRGPSQVTLQSTVAGKIVYSTSFRIAIAQTPSPNAASQSPFGVAMSSAGFATAEDAYATLWGAKWARVCVRWDLMEPVQGQYTFSGMDSLVNVYAQQNISVVAVIMFKTMPAWVSSTPGTAQYAAMKSFAQAVASHYKGKVAAWDLFNETDHYYVSAANGTGTAAVQWITNLINGVRAADSTVKIVCCSTGSNGGFLAFDQQIFNAGLLSKIDVVSMHPYMRRNVAPENPDGPYNLPGMYMALYALISHYGVSKAIWGTEGNYIIGPAGMAGVTAPAMDEHTQSLYDVRTNLLVYSGGGKYFLDEPWETPQTPYLHLDTFAGYANMAALFNGSTPMKPLTPGANSIYSVVGSFGTTLVGALWTTLSQASVRLAGVGGTIQFFDFYGNPISANTASISISNSPIYFTATSFTTPSLTVNSTVANPAWIPLQDITKWKRSSASNYQVQGSSVHVISASTTFSSQLIAANVPVLPHSCYVFDIQASIVSGAIALAAVDPISNANIVPPVTFYADGVPQSKDMQLRVETGTSTSVQFKVTDWNTPQAAVSEFTVSQPQYRMCASTSNGFLDF